MIPHESCPSPCLESLDRLPWAAGFAVESHEVAIGVRSDDPTLLHALRAELPASFRPVAGPEVARVYSLLRGGPDARRRGVLRLHLGFCGAGLIARTRDGEALIEAVGQDLHRCVAETTRAFTFVHAGVVALGDAALLIPGRTMAGKSTLVHALLAEGARYLSDEYAVLDADGRVHPYDKPLALRRADGGRPAVQVPALGEAPQARGAGLPVRWVVVTEYRSGARFRPRRITSGAMALALLANAVRARNRPDASLAAITKACSMARGLESVRGDARVTAREILVQVEGAGTEAPAPGQA